MAVIDDLQAGVAELTSVIDSSIQLMDNLTILLEEALANATPIEAVQAVIDSIKANKEALAAAVVKNTRP